MTDVHITWLGARLQEQQERIAALEAALHALVAVDPLASTEIDAFCFFCDTTARWEGSEPVLDHKPNCPWEVAQALLQQEVTDGDA